METQQVLYAVERTLTLVSGQGAHVYIYVCLYTILANVLGHSTNSMSSGGPITSMAAVKEKLDWPAQSSDLNLLEHLWDELERRLQFWFWSNYEHTPKPWKMFTE
ncbi:hypothetical protein XENOCAPTIV_007112 [Xenoophorus captivus]|uniref:Uncharacterized protein n=1 Tax=Xenoophorus captivus TaxID=1517983 RepID=A0ABV0SGJ1_9TELE